METAVVIVAAGRGTRAPGEGVPKQYRLLGGIPVLTRALEGFLSHRNIDAVLTVIHENDRALYDSATGQLSGSLLAPVPGGATRQDSVRAGLRSLGEHAPRNVLIHDAARPFTGDGVIDRVVAALGCSEGAVPAIAVTDTLKRVSNNRIEATVERANLWRAQTPQGFRFKKLLNAHRAAEKSGLHDFTDDSALAEWHGMSVELVQGGESNIKLTTQNDFLQAEQRMAIGGSQGEWRCGQGYDVHAFTDGEHVILGGVKIPHDRALAGHSDADVALHAITDAILGAIGDGDIGEHFPPTDPKWKDAASDKFLSDAARRVAKLGGRIVNVDVTIICEEPKIGPHREDMRERIAEILGVESTRVSVKATTSEGLGFTGRGEGIAAQASAMVRIG